MAGAKDFLTKDEVLARLRIALGAGEQKEFAERVGISQQHLCDLLRGRRNPAGKVLVFLELEEVEQMYRSVEKGGKR